jgi:hypothetical protein
MCGNETDLRGRTVTLSVSGRKMDRGVIGGHSGALKRRFRNS